MNDENDVKPSVQTENPTDSVEGTDIAQPKQKRFRISRDVFQVVVRTGVVVGAAPPGGPGQH